ncbi:MAG: RidA family protein [Rhodospirillaceae bacterium]|jgi:enamine deaminase RidA (YjgF/YER057c/UK114 family)|nr:RidA family protein [Rhodospirillaceae bacterium]MBT4589226.1 RidA family protein [Rhodospirillaceae bacterium]MBT5940286.1 RidA family protein [Rhodospirillaceae bacterium]MBT7268296.1 RidA family protein [Rhodospirillaceae bacterium]
MTIERLNPPDIYAPNKGIYTQVIKATGSQQIFLAGIVPFDHEQNIVGIGDMHVQVKQVLENIDRALTAAGAGRSDVVRINALATDVDVYISEGAPQVIEFFGDTKPTSTTYEVARLVHPDWLIEIEATAIID